MAGHGGARTGSGRKKKSELYATPIKSAEDKVADKLPQLAESLLKEALEGFTLTRETFEPAGIVMVDDVEIQDGENGPRSVKIKRLAFPGKEPHEMVLVKRVEIQTAPSRDAAKYLVNRIIGSPTQQIEVETAEKASLPDALEQAMLEAYGPDLDDDDDDFDDPDDDLDDFENDPAEDETECSDQD